MVEAVPEGWERHTTADIEIDIPETWDTFDLTQGSVEAIREEAARVYPEFASLLEQFDPENVQLFAFDTESVEFATIFQVFRLEYPLPEPVGMTISGMEQNYADWGVTVLSTDLGLTIGGSDAGSIESLWAFDSDETGQLCYIVQAEPNLQFQLIFNTGSGAFDALEPLFKQVAESFRILEAP